MATKFETKRLLLREFSNEDANSFYDLNADKEVMQHTGDTPFASIEDALALIENYSDYSKNGFGRWTVVRKSDKEILGWCGLKKHPEGFVDLGYRLHRKYWNQGYAKEAAKACLKYGFEVLHLEEIIGRTSSENVNFRSLAT